MKVTAIALLILTLFLPALAQERRQGGRNLQEMDSNHDGKISHDEWKGRNEAFTRLDHDGDGYITREELQEARRNLGEGLRNMDADKDGKISRQEWRGRSEMFDRLDSNKDDFLTRDELRQNRQNHRNHPPAQQN